MIDSTLIEDIRQWGFDKGILGAHEYTEHSRHKQAMKTVEEVQELLEAIQKGSREEARDAVGDIVVTLIMQCEMWDTGLGSCVYDAYQEIKNRTGKMVDGQFVKDD